MITAIKIQARGVLTLPKKIRTRMRINAGDVVYVQERDGGVFIAPTAKHDPVLEDLKRSLEDIRNGRVSPSFSNVRDFEAYMKSKRPKSRIS